MRNKQTLDLLDGVQEQLLLVKSALVSDLLNQDYYSLTRLKSLVETHSKEHNVLLGEIALLAGISQNTLTRLLKDPDTAKVSTLKAVLSVLGKSIYIGQSNE